MIKEFCTCSKLHALGTAQRRLTDKVISQSERNKHGTVKVKEKKIRKQSNLHKKNCKTARLQMVNRNIARKHCSPIKLIQTELWTQMCSFTDE